MTDYAVFGDSIARGAYDPKNGGWVRLLEASIETKTYGDKVYNLGVSGDTSTSLLKRFNPELSAREPDIVLIAIGINDGRLDRFTGKPQVDISTFKSNLEKIYSICKSSAFVKKIIFIGISRVDEKKVNPWKDKVFYYNKTIKEYDSAIQKIAQSHKLLFIPMNDILEDSDICDGLHPNEKGHKKMFKRVTDYLT